MFPQRSLRKTGRFAKTDHAARIAREAPRTSSRLGQKEVHVVHDQCLQS